MDPDDCVQFQPFSQYDWTFARIGWLKRNPIAFCLIAGFCAVAYVMCIELIILVYVTFKRHSGLYFWSIIVTTIGIILQTTGYILKEFKNDCPPVLTTIICKVGWVSNVTGFSIVLWSRLHLVVRNPRILRLVLVMIIVDGILLHTPVVVFEFGLISRHHSIYVRPMEIMERIQQTIFTCQETVISGLYIYHTWRFLRSGYASHTRKVIGLLVAVQTLVILLDAGLTTFDYSNMFTLKCTVHPFVYSVKLKLEFIVLNQLLTLVKRGMAPCNLPALASAAAADDKNNPKTPPSSDSESQSPGNSPTLVALPEKHKFPFFLARPFRFLPSKAARSGGAQSAAASQAHQQQHQASSTDSRPSSDKKATTKTEEEEEDHVVVDRSLQASGRHCSDQTLYSDETDLVKVIGNPEDGEAPNASVEVIDDIERQYLGRFGMGSD